MTDILSPLPADSPSLLARETELIFAKVRNRKGFDEVRNRKGFAEVKNKKALPR